MNLLFLDFDSALQEHYLKQTQSRITEMKLTVIIRDTYPLMHFNDPLTYRSVHINLTPEQLEKLTLRHKTEEVSTCFLEPSDRVPK